MLSQRYQYYYSHQLLYQRYHFIDSRKCLLKAYCILDAVLITVVKTSGFLPSRGSPSSRGNGLCNWMSAVKHVKFTFGISLLLHTSSSHPGFCAVFTRQQRVFKSPFANSLSPVIIGVGCPSFYPKHFL